MLTGRLTRAAIAAVAALALAAGCGGEDETSSDSVVEQADTGDAAAGTPGTDSFVDPVFFDGAAMAADPVEVDCDLEDGTTTRCWELTFWSVPDAESMGPFCPTSIDDADAGIWVWDGSDGVEAGTYLLDEAFWELMEDAGYDFVESDGSILISDPGAGAPPTGDGADSSCLEATPQDFSITYQLPLTPSVSGEPQPIDTVGHVGVGVDGLSIFGDAPTVADTGNLPALDPCGGHVDPAGYYHWHFVSESIQDLLDEAGVDAMCTRLQTPSSLFGFAYDGYPIFGPADADGTVPDDLDECNGHVGSTLQFPDDGYHYHATLDAPNLPPCLVGAVADEHFGGPGGAVGGPPPGGGPPG